MKVTKPPKVCISGITYILVVKGFLYFIVVIEMIDWHSDKVLASGPRMRLTYSFRVRGDRRIHYRLQGCPRVVIISIRETRLSQRRSQVHILDRW